MKMIFGIIIILINVVPQKAQISDSLDWLENDMTSLKLGIDERREKVNTKKNYRFNNFHTFILIPLGLAKNLLETGSNIRRVVLDKFNSQIIPANYKHIKTV
jgi:hypothetical protein